MKNVFKICKTYFSSDSQSMKISKILEEFYDRQILNIHLDQPINDSNDRDKKKKDKAMKKDKKEKKMSKKRNRLDRDSNDEANSNPFDQQDQIKRKIMFDNINNFLTVEQKKGIVNIVQPKEDGKPPQ